MPAFRFLFENLMAISVKQPTVWDVVFSLKTFAAAAFALYIAFLCDLPNPYWTMTAVYIVAHPLSGALTSKAFYRLLGTAIGGMATVIMLPLLIPSPELTTLGLALWLGGCLFISVLDRTPRAYVSMLAGYSAGIIAFMIVDKPQDVFDYATSRAEEISVGIICAALVGRLIFPRHAGPVLATRIDKWLKNSADLAIINISGQGTTEEALENRQKLAIDAVDLRSFTTHVTYDASTSRSTVNAMRVLQSRMVSLLPMVASCNDLINRRNKLIVEQCDGKSNSPKLDDLIKETMTWLQTYQPMQPDEITYVTKLKQAILDDLGRSKEWVDLVSRNLTMRLVDIMQIYSDCLHLRNDIVNGTQHQLRWHRFDFLGEVRSTHYDFGIAFLSAFSAVLAIFITVTLWRMTEWTQGGTAAMMTGIFSSLFATKDDPVPAIRGMLKQILIVLLIAFVLQFAILPFVDGYLPLMLCLGLVLIPAGIMMAIPSKFAMGMTMTVNLPNLLLLQSRLSSDFYNFININTAMILGIIIAAATASIVRSVGSEWSAFRLIRAGWMDIVDVAENPTNTQAYNELLHRMLDRYGLIAPRYALIPLHSRVRQSDILKDIRVGLDTIELQYLKDSQGPTNRRNIANLLEELAFFYRVKAKSTDEPDGKELLEAIDTALNWILALPDSEDHQRISFALTGLRQNLFGNAKPYKAVLPPIFKGQDA